MYLQHLSKMAIITLHHHVVCFDLNDMSNKKLVSLLNIARDKLDSSEKSQRIKCLFFRNNISPEQQKELNKNGHNNDSLLEYFTFVFKTVNCNVYYCLQQHTS